MHRGLSASSLESLRTFRTVTDFSTALGLTLGFRALCRYASLASTGFRQSGPDGRDQLPLRAQEVALQKVGSSSYQGAEEAHMLNMFVERNSTWQSKLSASWRLLQEITRRVNRENVWQAVYTAGVVLPRPVSECRLSEKQEVAACAFAFQANPGLLDLSFFSQYGCTSPGKE